jgi:hypothetical protein
MYIFVAFIIASVFHTCSGTNPDCALIVPKNPLTATGLATPYQLLPLNARKGPCNQANGDQSTFVQGAVIDTDTGAVYVYNPLVIDYGTTPAVAPVVPKVCILIVKEVSDHSLASN